MLASLNASPLSKHFMCLDLLNPHKNPNDVGAGITLILHVRK